MAMVNVGHMLHAEYFSFQLHSIQLGKRKKQEAQLLLGDRATRKHAKDS